MEGREKQMKIENKLISELKAHPKNPRKHPRELIERLKKSIQEYGFTNPVLVSKDNKILAGHARCKAAKELGINEVPTLKLDFEGAKADAYVIIDNKLNEMSEWDIPILVDLIKEIEQSDFDVSLTGFDEDEISDLFSNANVKEGKDDDYDVNKALEEATFVKPGDLWQLGKHRMLCGNATNSEDLKRLMGNEKANLVVTDPPYNCSYEGGTGMKIINDSWTDSKKFYDFLLSAFKNAYDNLADGSAFYCFHSDAEKVNFFNATINAGFHYSTTCIWVKNSLVIGRMDYQMRHEPIIYAFKNTAKHKFYGDRKQTTVWEFDRPIKSKLHPTTKPIPLVSYPIKMSSQENGIVLDLFAGSGSTLIACEQMNRICYCTELDPKYASVIIRRYVETYGYKDVFLIKENEKIPFSEINSKVQITQ